MKPLRHLRHWLRCPLVLTRGMAIGLATIIGFGVGTGIVLERNTHADVIRVEHRLERPSPEAVEISVRRALRVCAERPRCRHALRSVLAD